MIADEIMLDVPIAASGLHACLGIALHQLHDEQSVLSGRQPRWWWQLAICMTVAELWMQDELKHLANVRICDTDSNKNSPRSLG
jgi:hypothetical protein